jgi:hypothetical protein
MPTSRKTTKAALAAAAVMPLAGVNYLGRSTTTILAGQARGVVVDARRGLSGL